MNRKQLSLAQKKIWLLENIGASQIPQQVQLCYRFEGAFSASAFQYAIDSIIAQHPVLHSKVIVENFEAYNEVEINQSLAIRHIDLSVGVDVAEARGRYIQSDGLFRFDLQSEWPIRVSVLLENDESHIVLISIHSIAWDDFSESIFLKELQNKYSEFVNKSSVGVPPIAPALADDFYSQCDSEAQAIQSAQYEAALKFWQKELEDAPRLHELHHDFPRTAHGASASARFEQTLPSQSHAILYSAAHQFNIEVADLVYALLAITFMRLSDAEDLVLGRKYDKRTGPAIGPLRDFIPRRFKIEGGETFQSFLTRYVRDAKQISEHKCPFDLLVNHLEIQPSLSHHPVFQLCFVSLDAEDCNSVFPDLRVTEYAPCFIHANCDIEVRLQKNGEALKLNWVFANSLFKFDTVRGIADTFLKLLESLLAEPGLLVESAPIISEEDENWLAQQQGQRHKIPDEMSLANMLEDAFQRYGDRLALSCESQSVNYKALKEKVDHITRRILQHAPADIAEQNIAVLLNPGIEAVAAMLAVMRTGACYCPLDATFPDYHLARIVEDAEPALVISHRDLAATIVSDQHSVLFVEEIGEDVQDTDNSESSIVQRGAKSRKNPAYLLYTSGSSGWPKGVLGTELSLLNRLQWMQDHFPLKVNDRICQKTAASFVDHLAEILQALLNGASLHIAIQDQRQDMFSLVDYCQKNRISIITMAPSVLSAFLKAKALGPDSANTGELSHHLHTVICSGEVLTEDLVERCRKSLPNTRLLNFYGSTESGADITYYQVETGPAWRVARYFKARQQENYFDSQSLGFDDTQTSLKSFEAMIDSFRSTAVPEAGIEIDAYIEELKEHVLDGIVQVSSQRYIGHMTSALPSFMPDLSKLISHLNQNVVKVETSRSMTLLERQVVATLHQLFFALPDEHYRDFVQDPFHCFGIVTSGGSVSNLTALWCARNQSLIKRGVSPDVLRAEGATAVLQKLGASGAVIIGSRLMHYSMRKTASLLGLGESNIRLVSQDKHQKISATDLQACIDKARAEGRHIIAIVGVAGATETGTVDPLPLMADIARAQGIHFHVDAAWGGAFQFSPHYREVLRGIERADTITLCPHKQLFLPQGISVCLMRDSRAAESIAVHANYQAMSGSFDLGQFSVEGSRPANSLLLHASLRLLGSGGYAWLVEEGMRKARLLAERIRQSSQFALFGEPEINIVNYRYIPVNLRSKPTLDWSEEELQSVDDLVQSIQQKQFTEGQTFVSKTKVFNAALAPRSAWVFRVVLSNPLTQLDDLVSVLNEQCAIAENNFIRAQSTAAKPVASHSLGDTDGHFAKFRQRSVPIGKPIYNTEISIRDRNLQILPPGVPGELCVSGLGLAQGYLKREEENRARFVSVENAHGASQMLYRSGDRARWLPNGNLQFLGRTDNQVKLRGLRMELSDIEAHVADLDWVEENAIALHESNDEDQGLVAFVVLKNNKVAKAKTSDSKRLQSLSESFTKLLRAHLQNRLPHYMVPSHFIRLDALPRRANNKLDRATLAGFAKSVLGAETHAALQDNEASELMTGLQNIWAQVLRRKPEDIDLDSDFFSQGGDSLSVISLVIAAKKHGYDLRATQLFQKLSIRHIVQAQAENTMTAKGLV